MRGADDFPDYLAARWAPLVRTVVLLGTTPALAARVVATGLGTCRRDWREVGALGDVDGEVLASVLGVLDEARRHRLAGADATTAAELGLDPDDPDAPEVHDLLDRLAALPPADRRRLVVVAVLDRGSVHHAGDHPALLPAVRRVAATVRVDPPPAPGALPTRLRPRRTGRWLIAGVAVLVVLLSATYVSGALRGDDAPDGPREERLGPVPATPAFNPLPVAWWSRGVLHLAQATVRVPDVVALVGTTDGAVVVDEDGRVVDVRADGTRTLLGRSAPDTGVVLEADAALVAWVEPDATAVVHDLLSGREVDRHRLDIFDLASGRAVTLDGGTLHLTSSFGDVRWVPGQDSTSVAQPPVLLDRAAGTTLSRAGAQEVRVEEPFFSVGFTLPGRSGALDADGTVVLTNVPDGRSAYGSVRLHDARTGEQLPTGLGGSDVAVASAFGEDGSVVHVVARLQDLPRTDDFVRSSFSGRFELRVCGVADGRCRAAGTVPASTGVPVLGAG